MPKRKPFEPDDLLPIIDRLAKEYGITFGDGVREELKQLASQAGYARPEYTGRLLNVFMHSNSRTPDVFLDIKAMRDAFANRLGGGSHEKKSAAKSWGIV